MTPDSPHGAEAIPACDYIAEAIEEAFGSRCPAFHAECHRCRAWAQYDALQSARSQGIAEGERRERERAMSIAQRQMEYCASRQVFDYNFWGACKDTASIIRSEISLSTNHGAISTVSPAASPSVPPLGEAAGTNSASPSGNPGISGPAVTRGAASPRPGREGEESPVTNASGAGA